MGYPTDADKVIQEQQEEIERLRADCEAIEKRKIRYAQAAGEARNAARVCYRKLLKFGMQEFCIGLVKDNPWLEEVGYHVKPGPGHGMEIKGGGTNE